ncbi:unnamed protein product [Caenorhabditis nigoni]
MKFVVVLFLVLAIAIGGAAGLGRHHLCGARLLDAMQAVCPNGCDSDFRFFTACARQMNMDELGAACCPTA